MKTIPIVLTVLLVAMTFGSGAAGRAAAAPGGPRPEVRQDERRPDPSDPRDVESFLDGLIPDQMRDGHVVGATVAVVKDGHPVITKGYGFADLTPPMPVVADRTLFYIGSAGKLFTWTAVMQLAEQGKLDLHADVNTYLDFTIPTRFSAPITVEHLLTHTAGFEDQLAALLAEPEDILPLRDFLVRYMPQRVQPPGRYFAYSNYGTALAGHIVERVSGEPYEQYVTQHILEPLEMKQSTVVRPPPTALMVDTSKGFKYSDGTYTAREIESVAAAPAGQIRTTATDMTTFMLTHLQGGHSGDERILQEATARDMHAPHFAQDPRLSGMAYGFVVSRENGQEVLWHDGESPQFATYVALLPRQQLGFFVSYNTPGVDPRATFSAFLDQFYPAPETPISRLPAVHSARTGQLAGTYIPMRANFSTSQKLVTWLIPLRVDEEADGTLRIGDQRYVESEPGLFIQVDGERRLSFGADAEGSVTHLFWGPLAYFKVPWYETPSVHGMALVLCLVAFLSGMVAWPAEALLRRARPRSPSPAAQLARWLAGLLGLLSLLLVAAWVVLMLRFADTYVYPVQSITWLTRLALLVVPLVLGVVGLGIISLRRGSWSLAWRLHYAMVMLAAVGLVGWLAFWNFLAIRG